jgi:hypothetical protein
MGFVADKIKAKALALAPSKNGKQSALVARRRVRARETSPQSTENLQDFLQPHLPAAIQTWVDGLGATKIAFARDKWVDSGFPDWKERRESARAIVEYLVGKAIERSLEVSGSYRELSDVLKSLEDSPEARRLLSPELFNSLRRASSAESAPGATEEKTISDSSQNSG